MEWTIKQVAEKTGLSTDTLRYYEKVGFIFPRRHENGYRHYNETDIAILKNIIVMKYAHFSLSEIKSMEEVFHKEPSVECNEVSKKILSSKIAELKQAIHNYQKLIRLIEDLLPMIDNADTYKKYINEIDSYINQIFNNIQKEKQSESDISPKLISTEGQ